MTIEWLVRSENPDISVVIPTLPEREVQAAEDLKYQSYDSYEVLAVRDESLDICEARNVGIESAHAEYIALTDDDTHPPQDWVSTAISGLSDDAVLVEGPLLIVYSNDDEVEFKETYRNYTGCNIAFAKEAWTVVGGFDSQFAGWGDDAVFGWEIERQFGLDRCRYDRSFRMRHIGELRSTPDQSMENKMRRMYQHRYFHIHRNPSSLKGRIAVAILFAVQSRSHKLANALDMIM